MASAGRVGLGTLSGAASGASIGSIAGPWGTLIGGGIGAIGGFIGSVTGEDEDEEKRRKAMQMLEQRQALENDAYDLNQKGQIGQRMAKVFPDRLGIADPIYGEKAKRQLNARGQQLERDQLREGMEPEEPGWRDWLGPLLGTGAAVAGAFKSDPRAPRRAQLNQTADEASWIDSLNLNPAQRATALEENDQRTRSALFGPRTRMSAYDF